jgi:hypothetical protein
MPKKMQSALASYLRTAASAALGAYIAGATSPKVLLSLAASSVAAPLLRALNPNDTSFGVTKK